MGQQLVLMKDVAESHLQDLHARGLVRAAMAVQHGFAKGIVMRTEAQAMSYSTTTTCSGLNCDIYWIEEILSSTVSSGIPAEMNLFALLQVQNGGRRSWADEVRSAARKYEGSGLFLAAAHTFGGGEHDAVVEVLGDEPDQVHEALLSLTDVAGVTAVQTLYVHRERTWGMGSTAAAS